MNTKEELLFSDRETVGEILNDSRRVRDIEFVIAEVFIDIRDLMVEIDKNLDHMKDSLDDINKHRYRNTGVR
jgi:hypothetical protein